MSITILRRALWLVAAVALGYAVFAFWYWRSTELLIAAGGFIILIPIDMLLAREERERRLPPHGPVRKWGYHEDHVHTSVVAGVGPSVPWWRRMYQRLPWWVAAWMPLLLIPAGLWLAPVVHAGPIEDGAYISVLDDNGIYYSSEQAAIDTAHAMCHAFEVGASFGQVLHAAVTAGMARADAAGEIGAAIGIYCPQHGAQLRPDSWTALV